MLDQESAQIDKEKSLLEQTKKDFEHFSHELPILSARHRELQSKVGDLEVKQKLFAELSAQIATLRGTKTELQGRVKFLDKEIASLKAEQNTLTPQMATIRNQIKTLQEEEKQLRENRDKLLKRKSALEADVDRLQKSKQHAEALLATLAEDKALLDGFKAQVTATSAKFNQELQKTARVTADWNAALDQIERSAKNLQKETDSLGAIAENLQANNDKIKRSAQIFVNLADESQTRMEWMAKAASSMEKSSLELHRKTVDIEAQRKKWAAEITADQTLRETASRSAQEAVDSLRSAVTKLEGESAKLDKQLELAISATATAQALLVEFQRNEGVANVSALKSVFQKQKEAAQNLRKILIAMPASANRDRALDIIDQVTALAEEGAAETGGD